MTNLVDLVATIAKQAMSNSNQNTTQNTNTTQNQNPLGGILGSVLSQALGGGQTQQNNQTTQNNNAGLNSILTSVLGQVLGGNNGAATGKNAILLAVIPLILTWIQQQGGLQAALGKLQGAGMSNQVNNWVDPNQSNVAAPVQNVQQLFNDQEVSQVAEQTQSTKQDVYGAIANVLPQIIDALTPQGTQTNPNEANKDIQTVLDLASQFLRR